MKKIRSFIAVPLPESTRQALTAVSQELAAIVPQDVVRWVTPESIHLTLSFLGDTAPSTLEEVASGLDKVAANSPPFTLFLDQLGCFPNQRRPRVVWVGLKGEVEALGQLKEAIDQMLLPLGWEPEARAFHPHLTLGRVKGDSRQVRLPWGSPVVSEPLPVAQVDLMESQLRPEGPRYTVRHTSRLG